MGKQNQHYVNKSLIKRFSQDGITINTMHLYHRPQFINKDDGIVNVVRTCEKVSEIKENVSINDFAFCSNDSYSDNEVFWSSALESLLNNKVENNLLNILFESNSKGQKNKSQVLNDCPLLNKFGITVDQIGLSNKYKSRINAFAHILTVSSHYELFQTEDSLQTFLNKIDNETRLKQFNDYKLFHIKFEKNKTVGKIILSEFPARYRLESPLKIDYSNPIIDNCDILVGDYEILLMCKSVNYIYPFLLGNIVFNESKVNLMYTNCINYYRSVKKSIVFASSETERLNELFVLFNSNEFRDYISITSDKHSIVPKRNQETLLPTDYLKFGIAGGLYVQL